MPTDAINALQDADSDNAPPQQPTLGLLGGLRWMWRQLTSMRTALILLFLLALGAVPGSLFPQRGASPLRVGEYIRDHPTAAPWLDRLGLFDVYASSWFAAIYLLLMVSLAGCILPRCIQYARNLRAVPPATPRNLARMPQHRTFTTDATESEVVDAAVVSLSRARFRLRPRTAIDTVDSSVAAEKGYLHELGNLIFHVSLLVLLVGVAWGAWFGYRGTVVIVEGDGFANTLTQYDDFVPGRGFSTSLLAPFSFTMDEFDASFLNEGPNRGQPDQYTADVTYRDSPDADVQQQQIQVNKPLNVNGTKVFLLGHGYAPVFTVRDGNGDVAFSGPVPALPQDPSFTSTTVVKVPDAQPEQLGFNVTVTPTAPEEVDPTTGPRSTFPEADDPRVYLGAWAGDLGLDSGVPQNVYQLDSSAMEQLGRQDLAVGETWKLPDGRGSITFDGLSEFANVQVAYDPGRWLVLLAAVAAIIGITLSLLVRRRRVWVRATVDGQGRTLVEVAGLAQTEWAALAQEVDAVMATLPGAPMAVEEQK
jgi:cytochrome c biogenesis protein